ncbi:MAG: hypothetical protein JW717_08270 [Marinilabiliaceae bacterium]|nr:hypothetical protein [Marinilabiliaceae bacterium]
MKTVLQIVLVVVILALGYFIWESIQKPIRFQQAYNYRKAKVIENLENIRDAQVAYKSVYNRFTSSFDTLVNFLKTDSLPLIKMEGTLTDSMIEAGITELKAIAMGLIKRDTINISVMDTIVGNKYNVDSLRYVPFSKNTEFEMGSSSITTISGVNVQVFEAKTPNDVYLNGLEPQEIINLNAIAAKLERYPGLKVGSLEEANNNAGNWE